MVHSVTVIPVGVAAIARKIHKRLATIMESGVVHTVPATSAGAAAIVPRIIQVIVARMEHGIKGIITVPAGVPVNSAGAGMIVRKNLNPNRRKRFMNQPGRKK